MPDNTPQDDARDGQALAPQAPREKPAGARREERLKAALKANMARRKAQAKARQSAGEKD